MEGKHPKRRKDKSNPYRIYELDGLYYIAFRDGQGIFHKLEIPEWLYRTFDTFELEDLSYLNVWDRHIEQSEVWDSTLNMRAVQKAESVEDTVIRRCEREELYAAINQLPEKQRKRLLLHFFEGMTFREIAGKEGCSIRAVEYSVHGALHSLKKYFEKN